MDLVDDLFVLSEGLLSWTGKRVPRGAHSRSGTKASEHVVRRQVPGLPFSGIRAKVAPPSGADMQRSAVASRRHCVGDEGRAEVFVDVPAIALRGSEGRCNELAVIDCWLWRALGYPLARNKAQLANALTGHAPLGSKDDACWFNRSPQDRGGGSFNYSAGQTSHRYI